MAERSCKVTDLLAAVGVVVCGPLFGAEKGPHLLVAADSAWATRNWEEASRQYREWIAAFPTDPRTAEAHLRLGTYLSFGADPELAVAEYREAVKLAPTKRVELEARLGMAALDYAAGDYSRAHEAFAEVLEEAEDWDLIKYATYTLKELDRKIARLGNPAETVAQCGIQALAEVFRVRGKAVPVVETASLVKPEGGMASLEDLRRAAAAKGVASYGVKLDLDQLREMEMPVIAHLRPSHFLVVTSLAEGMVRVVDPEWGIAELAERDFAEKWTGYSLIFPRSGREPPPSLLLSVEVMRRVRGGHHLHGNNLGGPSENGPSSFHAGPSSPSGCSGVGLPRISVNLSNFNLVVQDTEFRYSGRGPGVFLERTYNADDPEEGVFGRSWTFNYQVAVEEAPNGSVTVRRESGKEDFFSRVRCNQGTCTYNPPLWSHDTLVKNPNGTFTLRLKRTRLTQQFDSTGRLSRIVDTAGNALTLQYAADGKPQSVTDAAGRVTRFTYGANGKIDRVRDPAGREASYEYDAAGNLLLTRDMAGNEVRYTYDANSYMTSLTTPKGTYQIENVRYSESAFGLVVSTLRDPLGNTNTYRTPGNIIVEVRDANGRAWSYSPTGNGEVTSVSDPLGNTTNFTFNSAGDRTRITDANGNNTSLTYDTRGNVTQITDPLGNRVTMTYDTRDNLLSLKDPLGRTYRYEYDARDHLTKVTDPASGITVFSYDLSGQLISLTDARRNTTRFAYDAQGNLIRSTTPLGHLSLFTYDTVGRPTSTTTPKGDTITSTYDGIDRVSTITYPDGNVVTYTYSCCQLASITDRDGTLSFTYDSANRLTRYTDLFGKTLQYGYDNVGNLVALTYPDGKMVTYEYDAAGRMKAVTDWLANRVTYIHDAVGNLVTSAVSNGLLTFYRYDAASRLIALTNLKRDGSILSHYQYTLNALGHRTALVSVDPLSFTFPASSLSYRYDDDNQLISANNDSLAHDLNGNLVQNEQDGAKSFEYDFENRLTEAATAGRTTRYRYDRLGNRIEALVDGSTTRYFIDPAPPLSRLLTQSDSGEHIENHYIYGLGLVGRISGREYQFYQFDGLGSVSSVTDSAGTIKARYAYDPFGGSRKDERLDGSNLFKYLGRLGVVDDSDDRLYMRFRYFSPALGRFQSRDPLVFVSDFNAYSYAGSNPISFVDPLGLQALDVAKSALTVLITGSAVVVLVAGSVVVTNAAAAVFGLSLALYTGIGVYEGVTSIYRGSASIMAGNIRCGQRQVRTGIKDMFLSNFPPHVDTILNGILPRPEE